MGRPPLFSTHDPNLVAGALAVAFVEGRWELDDLVERGAAVLGRRPRWLTPLVRRLLATFDDGRRPRSAQVFERLQDDRGFRRVLKRSALTIAWARRPPPAMHPVPGEPASWPVPAILTPEMLAERLGLTPPELDWFADRQARGGRQSPGRLHHYEYRWQRKRSASSAGSARLIEAPKVRLKQLQRRLLDEILAAIPPHVAAHGFRPGRSVLTYVEPHLGRAVVLKMDLRDFFPSITAGRVASLFLTAGYPEPVAQTLAGLCTNSVPGQVWSAPDCPIQGPEHWRLRRLHREPHLPQGAPTSPALANLCAYRLDSRLEALAASAGARYTRYADDLAFSGAPEFARAVKRFAVQVGAIALEEGLTVQTRKTRSMRQSVRQRVAGVVLNVRPNLARPDFDQLKATLHNCIKHSPQTQNRRNHADFRAHLAGRIAYVAALNPERGRRLQTLFDQIEW